MNIIPVIYHPSWRNFMTPEIRTWLENIESQLPEKINPDPYDVMRFMRQDISNIKVVILGQDPYYQPGYATGRCFEVKTLTSWNQSFRQVSLKNIVRLLYKTYKNIENYSDIPSFEEIATAIKNMEFDTMNTDPYGLYFNILPPNELFNSWAKQGVLLLNTYLTVEQWKANSHREIWSGFAAEIIKYLVDQNPDINWFLWGSEAKSYSEYIKSGKIYTCRHPMMCDKQYSNDFLKSDCFKNTMHLINWLG